MLPAISLLTFDLHDRRFGLHLRQVVRVMRAVAPTRLPNAPEVIAGIFDCHGLVVPMFDVRTRLGGRHKEIHPDDHLILARCSNRQVGLVVDRCRGIQECHVQPPSEAGLAEGQGGLIHGVAQLADGLLLIHDLDAFLSPEEDALVERVLTSLAGATA